MRYVSVIIPAFNVEKYIGNTLKSIFNQDFSNFEIIIINDGSTDKTLKVIDESLNNLNRSDIHVKVISKKNEGVSVARNVGIEISQGEYIVFFDGDDIMEPFFLSTLYDAIIRENADMTWGKFNWVDEKGNVLRYYDDIYQYVPGKLEGKELLLKIFKRETWVDLCAAMYKRSIILDKRIFFTKGALRGQDIEFVFKYLLNVQKVVGVDRTIFKYIQRKGSATKVKDMRVFHTYATFRRLYFYFFEQGASKSFLDNYWKHFVSYVFVNWVVKPIFLKGTSKSRAVLIRFLKSSISREHIKNWERKHCIKTFKDRIFVLIIKFPMLSRIIMKIIILLKKSKDES